MAFEKENLKGMKENQLHNTSASTILILVV